MDQIKSENNNEKVVHLEASPYNISCMGILLMHEANILIKNTIEKNSYFERKNYSFVIFVFNYL